MQLREDTNLKKYNKSYISAFWSILNQLGFVLEQMKIYILK